MWMAVAYTFQQLRVRYNAYKQRYRNRDRTATVVREPDVYGLPDNRPHMAFTDISFILMGLLAIVGRLT